MVIGGSMDVPGGVRLTAEAALRAGAGKVRIGTVAPAALAIGAAFPEAAVAALPVNAEGEIDASPAALKLHLEKCDALVVGPAMSCPTQASRLLDIVLKILDKKGDIVIDAAALMSLSDNIGPLGDRIRPAVLTPHIGEIAAMLDTEAEVIERDRVSAARFAANRFNAIVALKGAKTIIAAPSGEVFCYEGGGIGLATSGSGDVLAGIVGGLLARGCPPLEATSWAVWLHGEAGRACARTIAPLGFLARELLTAIPGLMRIPHPG